MDLHAILRLLAAGRVVVGATLVVAPRFGGGRWIGPAADDGGVAVLTRALGVRDLALGLGTLKALEGREPVTNWLLLGAACDGVDFVATLVGSRRIGWRRALPVMVVAGAAAAIGAVASAELEK
jgi:hypothetical protein